MAGNIPSSELPVVRFALACVLPCLLLSPPLLAAPSSFALGRAHTCAIDDGVPWCWGQNTWGQVGDGSLASRDAPVPLGGGALQVVSIAAGWSHTCAVLRDGDLYCWGLNSAGQLGDGSTVDRNVPVAVAGLGQRPQRVREVVAGRLHTCALTERGRVWCWGDNLFSQLASSTPDADHVALPREVGGLPAVVELAAGGGDHTCARTASGAVWCWGNNHMGQTGEPAAVDDTVMPRRIAAIDGAIGIAAGYAHACARFADGGVQCWGNNYGGQLGQGDFINPPGNRRPPTAVAGLPDPAVALALGGDNSCAITAAGEVHCWGANTEGQCRSIGGLQHATPVPVQGIDGAVRAVGYGYEHLCVLRDDGMLACAGSFFDGRLGLGPDRSVFVDPQVVACGWDDIPGWRPEYADDIYRSALPWPVMPVSPARAVLLFADHEP